MSKKEIVVGELIELRSIVEAFKHTLDSYEKRHSCRVDVSGNAGDMDISVWLEDKNV